MNTRCTVTDARKATNEMMRQTVRYMQELEDGKKAAIGRDRSNGFVEERNEFSRFRLYGKQNPSHSEW